MFSVSSALKASSRRRDLHRPQVAWPLQLRFKLTKFVFRCRGNFLGADFEVAGFCCGAQKAEVRSRKTEFRGRRTDEGGRREYPISNKEFRMPKVGIFAGLGGRFGLAFGLTR